jgi:hypothetical protein
MEQTKIGTLTVTVDLPAATPNETAPNKIGTLTCIGTGLHSHHMTIEALAIAKGAEKLFALPINPSVLADQEPSTNIEDRRYMTSPYNPFMKAADRLSTTLADLFMPLLVANPFSAMRASPRR